jgi:hypothetical protein
LILVHCSSRTFELTCRQHCEALNLEKTTCFDAGQSISKTAALLAVRQ